MLKEAGKLHMGPMGRDLIAALVCALLIICLGPAPAYGAEGYDQVASAAQSASMKEVKSYGMIPVRAADINEGSYKIEVRTSSSFFRVDRAVLHVKDGKMTADLTMSSTSYKFVYPGKAEEAAAADLDSYIKLKERDGQGSFTLRVGGLNEEIPCAAFSKKKKCWYDRNILLDAGTLPREALKIALPDYDKIDKAVEAYEQAEEGEGAGGGDPGAKAGGTAGAAGGQAASDQDLTSYEPVALDLEDGEYSIQVNMAGGSGRASVSTPTWLIIKDGKAWARLLWSSSYYDYMVVGDKKYENETKDGGNSTFTIPIAVMDDPMPVIADTTAMGDPVEIEYELTFYRDSIGAKSQIPQEAATNVLIVALIIIVIGGVLNFVIKRRRKQ